MSQSPLVFGVYIYNNIYTEAYFRHNSEFSVNIDSISEFILFQVTPISITVRNLNITFDSSLEMEILIKMIISN